MGLRKTHFVQGEYYHIYNRGNDKKEIFLDEEDYNRFLKLLFLCNSTKRVNFRDDIIETKIDAWDFERGDQIVSIGAWVLMPNHFHLYLSIPKGLSFGENEKEQKGNFISTFMSKLCTSYTMYFNKKYNRTGSLFEGPFKSVHVSDDIQAKYLFSYIHLNPVKLIQKDWKEKGVNNVKKTLEFLDKYKWSSFLDFKGIKRKENSILNRKDFLDYFPTKENFKKEIFDWINIEN